MRRPPPGVLRVVGANVYYKNPAPRRALGIAASTGAHSIGFSEGSVIHNLLKEVGARRNYFPVMADAPHYQEPIDAADCPMWVRKNLHLRHEQHTMVSDRLVPHNGISPARTWTMVVYDAPFLGKGERVAHLNIHANWIEGIDTRANPVAKKYVDQMIELDMWLAVAHHLGTVVVLTGDWNSMYNTKKNWPTVYDIARKHKMSIRSQGLDGVAWSKRLVVSKNATSPKGWVVIPESRSKSDHPWLVADFKLKGK